MSAVFDTVLPADAVEFCPHPAALDILACGTYKLEDDGPLDTTESSTGRQLSKRQHRTGQCILLRIVSDSDSFQIATCQELSLPAVLDMKWCHDISSPHSLLGIADAEGQISILGFNTVEMQGRFIEQIQSGPSGALCLSLDWSNRRMPNGIGSLIVSASDGYLSLLCPSSNSGIAVAHRWYAHDYEPWTAAWDYWHTSIVFSGGDDLKLKGWDVRERCDRPIYSNERFDAGITSIQSNPHIENLIAVGSYDGKVRLFDTRRLSIPLEVFDVDGGVWRVKWHPNPSRQNDLLAACMHDGFKVVRFSDSVGRDCTDSKTASDARLLMRYDAHESLAYGADWSYDEHYARPDTMIASCSFYDHSLHLWRG